MAYKTLKQAGCLHIAALGNKEHLIFDANSGDFEIWFANKYHASFGLIYKNTHLEFLTGSIPQNIYNEFIHERELSAHKHDAFLMDCECDLSADSPECKSNCLSLNCDLCQKDIIDGETYFLDHSLTLCFDCLLNSKVK